jgi:hypothetical protein
MATTAMSPPRAWREARRLRAWELKPQGWTQPAIAEALGVTPGAVSRWMTRAEAGASAARAGPAGYLLRPAPLPGSTGAWRS